MGKQKIVAGSVKVRFLKPHMVNNPLYGRRSGPGVPSFVCIEKGAERELPRSTAETLVKLGTCEFIESKND